MFVCHCINQRYIYITKTVSSHSQKTPSSKMRKVTVQDLWFPSFPHPWVIGPGRTRSWSHQRLLAADPSLPGSVAKGNVVCLGVLWLLVLGSFLPWPWIGPYWTKEDETVISYIPPASFTFLQGQWSFSNKTLSKSWSPHHSLEPSWPLARRFSTSAPVKKMVRCSAPFEQQGLPDPLPLQSDTEGDMNTGSLSSDDGWARAMAPGSVQEWPWWSRWWRHSAMMGVTVSAPSPSSAPLQVLRRQVRLELAGIPQYHWHLWNIE